MKAGYLAAALALFSTSAAAASYAYFDRPDNASANSHAAVSNDIYVRGFGWAWGELQFKQDPGAATPSERQARDGLDRRDAVPGRHNDGGGNAQPRNTRGKISMNLAATPSTGTEASGPGRQLYAPATTVVR
ncbi:hypothetical protein LMG23992_03422 [Cupriavidus laharis]|uniref:Porin n=1 Tax=Cupriavidus laharis TaxID=151654 RepID=A0ABM8XB33_9BURK|nr:hypothetical protein [Cupriavidus laharis]CAG9177131.1 hypothetical protein LMG23992_03422 [Cupriavidus laharis]